MNWVSFCTSTMALLVLLVPAAWAQTGTITGTVTDSVSGDPLPGVNVVIEGTQQGDATGPSGQYSIEGVEPGTYAVRATFIGYGDEVREGIEVNEGAAAVVDFAMQVENLSIEEIVVIGYGQAERGDLTGSVSSVEPDELAKTPSISRIDQALEGRVAGVRVSAGSGAPGANPQIRIRGGNSITASNEPLYVIDGVPGGDLSAIDPDDIESMEILKDATSTSIYGARGANGVVLITTKQGVPGKPQISFSSNYGWQEMARTIDVLEGRERAEYANEHAEHTGQPIPYPDLSQVKHTDWQQLVARTAPTYSGDVSISGGSENARYYLSGSYFDQKGIIQNSGLRRYKLRMNLDYDLTDRLALGTHLNLARVRDNHNKVWFSNVIQNAFTSFPVRDENGEYVAVNPVTSLPFANPIAEIDMEVDYTNRSKLTGDFFAEYQFTEGFRLRSSLGTDYTYARRNQYDPATLPLRRLREEGGAANINNAENTNLVSETTAHLDQDIGENHSVDAVAGFSYETYYRSGFNASSEGFSNDVLQFYSLQAGDPSRYRVSSGYTDWSLVSFLSRVNYTFRDRYLFTISARRDGSSRFGRNDKWAFFPSGAFAWRIAEEPFLQDVDALSNLKLRASYGLTGNQAISPYATLPTLRPTTIILNGSEEHIGYRGGKLPNPGLRWETTSQFDVGVEAGFFNGRLNLTLDYYTERTRDLLLNAEIPFTTGYSQRLANVGAVQNRGLELTLETVNIRTNNFRWATNFNISGNRNKTVDLGEKEFVDIGYGTRLVEGQPAPVFVGWMYMGTWKTQEEIDQVGTMPSAKPGYPRFKDLNGDGSLGGEGDFAVIGNPEPTFFGGIQNTFGYKGWELGFFVQGTYGNDVLNQLSRNMFFGRYSSNIYEEARNRWTPENPDSDIPRAGSEPIAQFRMPKSVLVEDGSYLRLKSLSLSYDIPVERLGLMGGTEGLQVYMRGRNLLTWTNFRGFDPEVGVDGLERSPSYPRARMINLGVQLRF